MNDYKDKSIISGTLRIQDLLPEFLNILRDIGENKLHENWKQAQAEYTQLSYSLPAYVFEDEDCEWWDDEGVLIVDDLLELLNWYALDGYYFGAHSGDGSDFGFWRHDEQF